MTNLKAKIRNLLSNTTYRQFIKFVFVGILNTVIFYGIYIIMLRLEFSYVVAVTIGTFVGVANSYIWNKFFTFKAKGKSAGEMIKFAIVYGAQYVSNIVVIHICITHLNISAEIAGLIAISVGVFISFFGHKFWSFKRGK